MERGEPMLWLKVGLHMGPYIVVNLNNKLNYFGSTVNVAARLPGFSQVGELILSKVVHADPEVQELIRQTIKPESLGRFTREVKGFDEPMAMWRVRVEHTRLETPGLEQA